MKEIIPPINPGTIGKEVANLQECLLFLLDKNDSIVYWSLQMPTEEEKKKYRALLREEYAASFFGDGTQQLVYFFQIQQGLGDWLKGEVEESTSAKLNELLKELGALDEIQKSFSVEGTVLAANGKPIGGVSVKIFDKDLRTYELLGEITTNNKGYYQISYGQEQFSRSEKLNADLILLLFDPQNPGQPLKNISALDANGKELEKFIISENSFAVPVWYNAPERTVVNFKVLETEESVSEWERLNNAVLPLLQNQKNINIPVYTHLPSADAVQYVNLEPSELNEDDFHFLEKETGLEKKLLRLWSLAYQHEKQTDLIPAEVFFAWYRQGLPQNLAQLIAMGTESLNQYLIDGINSNIISSKNKKKSWWIEFRRKLALFIIQHYLAPAKEGEKASFGDIISAPGTDWIRKEKVNQLAPLADALDPDADDFTSKLKGIDLTPREQSKLIQTLKLAKITDRNPSLMKALQPWLENEYDDKLKGLCTLKTVEWIDLTYTHGIAPGTFFDPDNYALTMQKNVELRYPTAFLTQKIKEGSFLRSNEIVVRLVKIFDENPSFDIVKDDIEVFAGSMNLPKNEEMLIRQIQNIKQTGADFNDIEILLNNNITSVEKIVQLTPLQIGNIVGEEMDTEKIQTIYTNAVGMSAVGIGMMGYMQSMFSNISAYVMGSTQPAREQLDNPTLRKLFGSMEQCACTPCRSVLSPAAYYADLLKFIDSAYLAGYMLEFRRPDLFDLELSCNNAEIELPHIDLVLEILENAVVLPLAFKLPSNVNAEEQLSKNQIGAEIRQVLQQTSEDIIGTLIAEKDNHSITRPRNNRPGVSYWTVKDQYRRWLITISKEAFGSATDIAANTGIDIKRIDFGLLTNWLNGNGDEQSLPTALKIPFEQLLLKNVTSKKGPYSIRSFKVLTNEESRNWTVKFTTGVKISTSYSSTPDKKHILFKAEDGSEEESSEYNSKTVEAAEKGLDEGEKKSILLSDGKNKNETIEKKGDEWIITGNYTIQLFYTVSEIAIEGLTYQSTAPDRKLLVKPQNRNPLAYEKLASVTSNFPWSLPFDQTLAEIRLTLGKAGLPLDVIQQSILPLGTENKHFRWSIEQLNLSPAQSDVIITPLAGEHLWMAWGLQKIGYLFEVYDHSAQKAIFSTNGIDLVKIVSILTNQAGITVAQLEELLACSRYLNPNYLVNIQYDQNCALDKTELSSTADEAFFDRLHRFIRLWTVTKFKMSDLDLLISLFPLQAGALRDREVFIQIANIRALQQKLQLPVSLILAFFQVFDNRSRSYFSDGERRFSVSLYEEIFLNKNLKNTPDSDFEFQKFSALNGAHPKALSELVPHISLCLGVKPDDIFYLVRSNIPGFGNQPVTINVLHHIWRHVLLLNALDIRIEEYVATVRLISPVANIFSTPVTLSDFCTEVSFISALKIKATELLSVLEPVSGSRLIPNEEIFNILSDLQFQLRQVGETDTQNDPRAEKLHKQKQIAVIMQVLSAKIETDKEIIQELITNKIFTTAAATLSAFDYFSSNTFWQETNQISLQGIERTVGYGVLIKLKRFSLLNQLWKVTKLQAAWFRKTPTGAGFTGIIPNSLPVEAGNSPVTYPDWKKSTILFSLSKQELISELLVTEYLTTLDNAGTRTRLTNARRVLASELGIDISEVNHGAVCMGMDVANQISSNPSPAIVQEQFDPIKFAGLLRYLFLLRKYSLTKNDIDSLLLSPTNTTSVQKARRLLTQIYPDGYELVLQQVNNQLRMEQRDRLVDYLCVTNNIKDSNGLYEYFLIDVQMQPCMQTTRLLQSTAAAQLFVHRALMNLEQPLVLPDYFDKKRWEWTQNYRVWEANRKVFLYPENWLYPELRDDKTQIFGSFENNIRQDEANNNNTKLALIEYTESLAEQSKIIVMGLHEYEKQGTIRKLFQVGRSINIPYTFYWREATNEAIGTKWTGWNRIDQNLSSEHLVPFSYLGEMYICWPIINKIKENNKDFYEVGLSWIKKAERGWSESKKSYDKIKVESLVNRDERSMFLLRNDENTTDPNQVNIEFYQAKPTTQSNWPTTNLPPTFLNESTWGIANETLISIHFRTFIRYINSNRTVNTIFGHLYLSGLLPEGNNANVFKPGVPSNWSPAYSDGLYLIKVIHQDNSDSNFKFVAHSDQLNKSYESGPIQLKKGKSLSYMWNVVFELPVDPEPQIKSSNEPVNMLLKGKFRLFNDKDGEWIENKQTAAFELVPPPNSFFYCSGLREKDNSLSKIEINNQRIISSKSAPENFFCIRSSRSFSLKDTPVRFWQIEEGSNKFLVPVDEKENPANNIRNIRLAGHPESNLIRKLSVTETSSLFDYQLNPDFLTASFGKNEIELAYDNVSIPATELLPFNAEMPNGLYNWEVFFHLPFMAASYLSSQHRYAEARNWYHYIFDPTTNDPARGPERFWKFLPFRNNSNPASVVQLMDILANPNAPESGKKEVRNQITAWMSDPFNPFAVARMRIGAFQWHTVISYVKNLIQWGDQLFRRDTRESINEATMLYVTAYHFLGSRPQKITKRDASAINMSYRELGNLDEFSNRWVSLIDTPFGKAWLAFLNFLNQQGINPNGSNDAIKQLLSAGSAYFCIPPNEKITELWDLTEDRLFKIRNCRNIEGAVRSLPLLDPPIDPELLIRARAKGVSISDAIAGLYAPAPFYRFNILFQKAMEICNEVKNLGASLLSAIEKKEGEHLNLLRSGQEMQMQLLISSVREEQIKEASAQIDSLKKTRENMIARILYLQKQMGINELTFDSEGIPVIDQSYITQAIQKSDPLANDFSGLGLIKSEEDQILWMQTNNVLNLVAGGFHTASGLAHTAGATYAPLPPGTDGPARVADAVGKGLSAFGTFFNTLSSHYGMLEKRSGQMANWQRRRDEWLHLAKTAVLEIKQLDKQIVAADIKLNISQKELMNHQKQMEYTKELDEYIRVRKFSKETMYAWMEKQIADVYFAAYQLAVDYAAKAEKAYQFELGEPLSNFLKTGYWDNLQKGLLAGEALMQDLRRMETAYYDNNKREYEIVKHISLALLDPLSLLQLKKSGKCQFNIPEVLFDMDFPGHYFRRIKSVSISIPCIAGPNTSVSSTLRITSNRIRKSAQIGNNYIPSDNLPSNKIAVNAIATSNAQNDSGIFELNFRDERYLPFEGAGVISDWELELPAVYNITTKKWEGVQQFNYDTISDVIVHVKYTAREGGSGLKNTANLALNEQLETIKQRLSQTGLHMAINMKHDFPNDWHQLKAKGSINLIIGKSRLPYMAASINTSTIESVMFVAKVKDDPDRFTINVNGVASNLSGVNELNLPGVIVSGIELDKSFNLSISNTDQLKLEELIMIVKYQF